MRHDAVDRAHPVLVSASYSSPRKKISRANFWPTWRARYADPKPPSKDPTSASVCLNRACSALARVRSETTCRLWPPPAAQPGTTQMTTLGMNRISRWHSRMCSRASLALSTGRLGAVSARRRTGSRPCRGSAGRRRCRRPACRSWRRAVAGEQHAADVGRLCARARGRASSSSTVCGRNALSTSGRSNAIRTVPCAWARW